MCVRECVCMRVCVMCTWYVHVYMVCMLALRGSSIQNDRAGGAMWPLGVQELGVLCDVHVCLNDKTSSVWLHSDFSH